MKPGTKLPQESRKNAGIFLLLASFVLAILAIKANNDGWFEPRKPLELNGQPTLIFFTLRRGCECQMLVIRNAEAQLAGWSVAQSNQIPILSLDFYRRADLAEKYQVARPPALVLLDAVGEVVWKQDLGLSDDEPLDLNQAQSQLEALLVSEIK